MRFHEKDFEIPQVCLDLGFEDRSHHKERSARMYNPQLDLTLWVSEPSAGRIRYALQDRGDGMLGEVETDNELRKLVASVRGRVHGNIRLVKESETILKSLSDNDDTERFGYTLVSRTRQKNHV